MMIFKKALSRRTFLRGTGAALALPLLDSMIPAFAATGRPVLRLGFVYCPNGMIMQQWRPATDGVEYKLSPILEPLAPFRNDFLLFGNLSQIVAYPKPGEEGDVAPHERAGGAFLTGAHPSRNSDLAISVDQIAAKELGKDTQLASLELALHDSDLVGQCEKGWNCAYMRTLSWRGSGTPLPNENNPRRVFERLFGDNDTTDQAERIVRNRKDRSLLDSVTEAAARLSQNVGPNDRAKLAEYLDAIRDVERRIQTAEDQASRELPTVERPRGIPATFDDHAKLMFDLVVLAFQTDLTRVFTFMMGREQSDRSFREIGIPDPHHMLTHHSNDPVKIKKVTQINIFHSQMFAYLLEKLKSTPEADGSLLDRSMILYGSGISEGNLHLYVDLPLLLAGGKAAQVKGGRYIRYAKDTPLTNLHTALLDKLGITAKIGDSTGSVDL